MQITYKMWRIKFKFPNICIVGMDLKINHCMNFKTRKNVHFGSTEAIIRRLLFKFWGSGNPSIAI